MALSFILENLLTTKLKVMPEAWPFLKPVNKKQVKDYYNVIKKPIDMETMGKKIQGIFWLIEFIYFIYYIFNYYFSYHLLCNFTSISLIFLVVLTRKSPGVAKICKKSSHTLILVWYRYFEVTSEFLLQLTSIIAALSSCVIYSWSWTTVGPITDLTRSSRGKQRPFWKLRKRPSSRSVLYF